jgi:Ca2+:H+ antiporter
MSLDRILADARALATTHRHQFVGTEHLLATLLDQPESLAATTFGQAGLNLSEARDTLLNGLKTRSVEEPPPEEIPLSGQVQQLVQATLREAKRRNEPAGERDLLAVLIRQPRGRIASLLRAAPAAVEKLRDSVGGTKPKPEPKPEPKNSKPASRPPSGESTPARRAAPPRPNPPPEARSTPAAPRIVKSLSEPKPGFPWSLVLLLAVPASIVLNVIHASPVAVFVTACIGVLPLAGLMGEATEALSDRTGPTIGGLLNATFGNAAELIIALVALRAGLVDLVKASITGSILGNLLLILGLAFIAGGGRSAVVKFSRTNAGMSAAMLALAAIGLVFPALFHATRGANQPGAELHLSEVVSVILILTYAGSLLFSLRTHSNLFGGGGHPAIVPKWSVPISIVVLALATAGVVVESELLVHAVEAVTVQFGMSQTFLGLVIIPIIGNAAEHATAVVVARKGQADLALQIALGSSTQVALLVAPVLVFAGVLLGSTMNLVFTTFEVTALGLATAVISIITLDGEAHWFEGLQLLAVYGMVAAAAFFI